MKMRFHAARAAFILLPSLLVGCGKEDAVSGVLTPDTVSVVVVVDTVRALPFEEMVSYPAELRGLEDAVLVTSAAGLVRRVAEVGRRVRAGEAMCDIESERYQAQYAAAAAAVDLAQSERDRVQANVEAGSVGRIALQAADVQLLGARAQMLGARKQFEDSRCQAPFSGVVASRKVERWATVGPGTPTIRLVRTDRLEAVVGVPESDAVRLQSGEEGVFMALDGRVVRKGRLTAMDQVVEPRHRTMQARLEVANPDGVLRPGLVGRASLLVRSWDSAVLVPSVALLRKEGGLHAMIVRDGRAREVPVTTGASVGDSVQILEGVVDGDLLIVQGAFRTTDGTRVTH